MKQLAPDNPTTVTDAELADIRRRFDEHATPATLFDGGAYKPATPPASTAAYAAFLDRKAKQAAGDGFDPIWMPDFLFDFQRALVDYAIRKGRAALFADTGLGKTGMQLVWAENVVRKAGRPVLLLTPLAVGPQTVREGEKFGIRCVRSLDGTFPADARIVVANYERLHYFKPADFAGIVCDESSCLKAMDGTTRELVTDFAAGIRYRLLCTATAAPNDFHEVGTSSECLGHLGARDMLTKFFKEDLSKDHLGWNRRVYRLRGHAEEPFWRWVCSWARACRKPSDLGFSDARHSLPPLVEVEHVVRNTAAREGMLFSTPAVGLREQREERRVSMPQRCRRVSELIAQRQAEGHGTSIVWCQLNPEGDMLEKLIPNARQVSGSTPDDVKEEIVDWFLGKGDSAGGHRVLVSKAEIFGFGLNFQHCAHVVTFPTHSWEKYYQAVRRCYRFGQTRSVVVDVVTTEGESGVSANLKRKAQQADRMFSALVEHMADAVAVDRGWKFEKKEKVPAWLSTNK